MSAPLHLLAFGSSAAALSLLSLTTTPARAETATCAATGMSVCGAVVIVGDTNHPCIQQDGKVYCPVFNTYDPRPPIVIV